MTDNSGTKRVRWQMTIYTAMQVLFAILLLYMAVQFQQVFRAKGMPEIFLNSVLFTLGIQLLVFYPIYRFSLAEARREIAATQTTAVAELQQIRKQRIYNDFLKATVFIFFATFLWKSPPVTFALSTAFFSFMLTVLTYLQCFNFAAKRLLRGELQ